VLKTAKDVAARLNVSEAAVYDMVREKLLPCVRLGRRVRFDPGVLERWIEQGGAALPGGWRRSGETSTAHYARDTGARPR
jgi:excisionase family DNA binding protein